MGSHWERAYTTRERERKIDFSWPFPYYSDIIYHSHQNTTTITYEKNRPYEIPLSQKIVLTKCSNRNTEKVHPLPLPQIPKVNANIQQPTKYQYLTSVCLAFYHWNYFCCIVMMMSMSAAERSMCTRFEYTYFQTALEFHEMWAFNFLLVMRNKWQTFEIERSTYV